MRWFPFAVLANGILLRRVQIQTASHCVLRIRTLSHFLTAPLIFSPPRTIIQIRKIRASSNHETRQVEGGDGTLVRVTLSSLKSTCGCWRNVVRSSTFPIICSTLFTSSSLTCKSHIHFIAKHALRKLGLYEFICTVYE